MLHPGKFLGGGPVVFHNIMSTRMHRVCHTQIGHVKSHVDTNMLPETKDHYIKLETASN